MSRLRALGCAVFAAAMTVISAGVVSERANAASPCWERVIADWSDNGRVDRTYQLVCYREAVKRMPEDLRAYSSAPAEIDRALAERRVALPASSGALPSRPASSQRDAGGAGPSLAMLVPPAAAVFAALAVGWWLFGARRRRPSRGRCAAAVRCRHASRRPVPVPTGHTPGARVLVGASAGQPHDYSPPR